MIWTDSDDDLALMDQENGRCFLLIWNLLLAVRNAISITSNYLLLGKPETKAEVAKVSKSGKPVTGASAKQVKIVDPKKDEDESDDESVDEDEFSDEVL